MGEVPGGGLEGAELDVEIDGAVDPWGEGVSGRSSWTREREDPERAGGRNWVGGLD